MNQAEKDLFKSLKELIKTKNVHSESAKIVFKKHKEWLSYTWKMYSKEAHIGLAEMYLEDKRFISYYNERSGTDAIYWLTESIKMYA